MIIDTIYDLKASVDNNEAFNYSPKKLYDEAMSYFQQGIAGGEEIANAMDTGDLKDIKKALTHYLVAHEYLPTETILLNSYAIELLSFIYEFDWLKERDEVEIIKTIN